MGKAQSMSLKELLQEAKELGFDLVKVTSAEPLTDVEMELERRLQLGLSIPLMPGNSRGGRHSASPPRCPEHSHERWLTVLTQQYRSKLSKASRMGLQRFPS